jgi:PQQ-dependent dehydrogenase (methanol/ethanol family)
MAFNKQWTAAGTLIALMLAACSPSGTAEGEKDWEFRGGNAEGQHFSALNEIDQASISRLGLAWYADLPTPDGPVGTPIVVDGVSYVVSSLNMVFAHDLRTGKLKWTFDPKVRFGGALIPSWGTRITRGLAYAKGKILITTGDCRLIAIDAKTSKKKWESRVCPEQGELTITSAPRVGDGLVFVGPNNADVGTARGYVDAFDIDTGKHAWRFTTIPGGPDDAKSPALQKAAKTWDPDFLPKAAGGSVWEDMTYDPVTKLLYIGVGGASPWNPVDRGAKRGDELFSNSIVALNATTGEYVWHYQTTPGDGWNLEPTMPKIMADMKIDGKMRRVLLDAPKNGFFYVLDALTGKLINKPQNFVPVNWAKEIDFATGRPVPSKDAEYWTTADGVAVRPGALGGHNFNPMSYSPRTGLVYIPTLDLPIHMSIDRNAKTGSSVGGAVYTNYQRYADQAKWSLVAWDPVNQRAKWKTDGSIPSGSGVLSTGGDIVFQGAADGVLRAYRATDGKQLWSFSTGSAIVAAPVTVEIDGVQTLIVVIGNAGTSASARAFPGMYGRKRVQGPPRILAFRLNGKASLPSVTIAAKPFPKPPLPRPDQAIAMRGKTLFETRSCDLCHGAGARAIRGSVPDLRRSNAEVHGAFEAIVRGGGLQERGMPMFLDMVSPEDSAALQAFVLYAAWDAYEEENGVRKTKN